MEGIHIKTLDELRNTKYSATSCSLVDAVKAIKTGSQEIKSDEIVLGRKLGEGAMAIVYEAKFRGISCAAKKLKQGVSNDSKQYNDLLVELEILASIGQHQNIVNFHGACMQDPSSPIIIVELMGGQDLESFLSKKRSGFDLGHQVVFSWSLDLLRALDHLHNRDPMILHRDVKPENLLLTKDQRTLKLSDFGLGKKVSKKEVAFAMHKGSTGTLRYMAPEVLGSLSAYTDKADIYSAAMVMCYMLTGYKPNVDIRQSPEERPSLTSGKARWAEVAELIARMWHIESRQRPTAGECIEALLAVPNIPKLLSESAPGNACCALS